MSGQTLAYIRVSTVEQHTDRQEKAIKDRYQVDKYFIEKVSAKDRNRQQLKAMLDYARQGDRVVVSELSRLARNTQDLLNIVAELQDKEVELISLKEQIDTSTPTGKLMLTMIGAINEFERDIIRERQAEGIAIAKSKGKYKGKSKIKIDDKFIELFNQYQQRKLNKVQFAKAMNISRTTLDRMIRDYKEEV